MEMLDYLADIHASNVLAIDEYPAESEEVQAHLDSRREHAVREIEFLVEVKNRARRLRRTMLLLWAAIVLLLLALPVVGAAAYLMGRVDEGNEWVSIDDAQFCQRLGADAPNVHFE